MAITLAQAAVLSENDLQASVVEKFVQASPILDRLPFIDIDGNAYAYNSELALPGVEFRAVNSAYTESTGTFVQATESLVILGGDADVDTFIQATRSEPHRPEGSPDHAQVKAVLQVPGHVLQQRHRRRRQQLRRPQKRLTGGQVIAVTATASTSSATAAATSTPSSTSSTRRWQPPRSTATTARSTPTT